MNNLKKQKKSLTQINLKANLKKSWLLSLATSFSFQWVNILQQINENKLVRKTKYIANAFWLMHV